MLPPFTHITLALALWGLWRGVDSHAWAVAVCLLWGSLLSFTAAPLVDPTVYARMRRKNGWSTLVFHAGNLVLHVAPLGVTFSWPPTDMTLAHGVVAVLTHAAWGVWAGGATLCLDDVYVPLHDWRVPWGVAWASEIGAAVVWASG